LNPEDFPRILFITPCAFNRVTGGGITFSNLFSGWPSYKLATITDDPVPVDHDVCQKYFILTSDERNYIRPLHLLKKFNSHVNFSQTYTNQKQSSPLFVCMAKSILGDAGIPDRGVLTPLLFQWLKEYKPEVIYTILGTKGYIELVDEVHRAFPVPLVIHLMDDGVTDPRKKGLFGGYLRKTYSVKLASLMRKTSLRMAICEMMAREYKERYNMDFVHFQNTIDVTRWEAYVKKEVQIAGDVRIAYIGSILPYAQMQSIIDICEVVKRMNNQGKTIFFDIYTHKDTLLMPRSSFEIHPRIKIGDAPTNDEDFFRTMANSNLLVLPVNFDKPSIQFIRLSMPTKIPAYLASGRPILAYGPPKVAQIEYARDVGWGYIVDERNLDYLERGLSELIDNCDLRYRLSLTARKAAEQNHDVRLVRKRFQKSLQELVLHE